MSIILTDKQRKILNSLGHTSLFDVIEYFPYKYDDYVVDMYLDGYHHNNEVTIKGMVLVEPVSKSIRANLNKIDFSILFNNEEYKVVCFNRNYLMDALKMGKEVIVQGKYNHYRKEITLSKITLDLKKEDRLTPVYRLKEGMSHEYSTIVKRAFEIIESKGVLKDNLPKLFKEKYKLVDKITAYKNMHFPKELKDVNQANRYLKYEELLTYALTLLLNREKVMDDNGVKKIVNRKMIEDFIKSLPYKLTTDQYNASYEIIKDIESGSNMYRLLQGDVGSGKTVVSAIALLSVVSASYQGALMAPTDILANQHYVTISKMFKDLDVKVALLVSSMTTKEKREVKEQLKNGEIDIVIGTHAIIQDDVEFKSLGLVIIDEQHRFGVMQRNKLRKKGEDVDFLLMSATPIPRTLAISVYGDMDITTLHEFPGGVREVDTRLEDTSKLVPSLEELENMLSSGSKMYVVCPLIDGNEKSVNATYEMLKEYYEGKYKVLYVHGKLSGEEKERIIKEFNEDDNAKVLVSTTVIEVGIDIKNADIMLLLGAERFGLAAIHQLRGRIGRHGQKGVFIMFSDDKDDNDRLRFMTNCNDGFEIARFDLQKRGPGDVVGSRQSGMVELRNASLIDDIKILEVAREDAKYILRNRDNEDFKNILKSAEDSYNSSGLSID